ncbi:hypothetical protein CRG98_011912, partial [Punica granatum]
MMSSFFFSFLFFTVLVLPLQYGDASEGNDQYLECSRRFVCGDNINVTYPFWGEDRPWHCGLEGFQLLCEGESTSMVFEEQRYRVFNINQTDRTMNLSRDDLVKDPCLYDHYPNTTIDNHTLLHYSETVQNISIFYGCSDPDSDPSTKMIGEFSCPYPGDPAAVAIFKENPLSERPHPELNSCRTHIKVPVLRSSEMLRFFLSGFVMEYSVDEACSGCELSNGICGRTNGSSYGFSCYCNDKPYPISCPHRDGNSNNTVRTVIVVVAPIAAACLLASILYVYFRRVRKPFECVE